jgi:hypothetical protein
MSLDGHLTDKADTMSILLAWEDNSDPGGPESP